MKNKPELEAVIIFDTNLPKPRRSNHITPENFHQALRINCLLINVPRRLKNISRPKDEEDKIVLNWVIKELIPSTMMDVRNLGKIKYYFFVTKDLRFKEASGFDEKLTNGFSNGNAKLVLLFIPSKGSDGRDLHRYQILEKVIEVLNGYWNRLSSV